MIDKEAIVAASDISDKTEVLKKYLQDMPRFKVWGMNQAELVYHLFIMGFMAGVRWQKGRK